MMPPDLIRALGFAAPMFTALLCVGLCMLYYFSLGREQFRKHALLIILFLCASAFCWLGAVLFLSSQPTFIVYNTFFFLVMTLDQVFLYHFIFIITGTDGIKSISRLHYIIPFAITVAMGIWSALVPYEVKEFLALAARVPHPDYPVYSVAFWSFLPLFVISSVFYIVLGFRRLKFYRREIVNYSADTQRISMRWLYLFMILALTGIPVPLAAAFGRKNMFFTSPLIALAALIPILHYLIITYNMISGNYVIIEPPAPEEKASPIDRKRFESYIKKEKPYLNPKLKITELAAGLNTNRTYVSAYINREYGMNFSRYINCCRLEELDHLRTSSQCKKYTNMELVLMAGFSSYRSYLRTKDEEDRRKILKVFE